MDGPYPKHHDKARAVTTRAAEQDAEEALWKVKKMGKPKKKESKKISENKEFIAEVTMPERRQQDTSGPTRPPQGDTQQVNTTATRSWVITARDLMPMSEGLSWLVKPNVYCTSL